MAERIPGIEQVIMETSDGIRTPFESAKYFACETEYTRRWDTPGKHRFFDERKAIETGAVSYYCAMCLRPVVLRGGRSEEGKRLHFKHKFDNEDCPYKDEKHISEESQRARKFCGTQEGALHEALKMFIAGILNNERFESYVEKTQRLEDHIRRPDVRVYDKKNDRNIIFEIQSSSTYLYVIEGRMKDYGSIHYPVIWIIPKFNPNEAMPFTIADTCQFQCYNVFVLDAEAQEKSNQEALLYLTVHYPTFYDAGNASPGMDWHKRLVNIDELSYDDERGVFYFDSRANLENAFEEISKREESEREEAQEYEDFEAALYVLENRQHLNARDIHLLRDKNLSEDDFERIRQAIQSAIYCPQDNPKIINPIREYLQIYQVAKGRKISDLTDIVRHLIHSICIEAIESSEDSDLLEGIVFNIMDYPELLSDHALVTGIYALGYFPYNYEYDEIKKDFADKCNRRGEKIKALAEFTDAINHWFVLAIAKEFHDNSGERREMLKYFYEYKNFIFLVASLTTGVFVEYNFNRFTQVCNQVMLRYKELTPVFLRFMENCELDKSEFISAKGVNHYDKILGEAKGRTIPALMDRLLHIIFPKYWKP